MYARAGVQRWTKLGVDGDKYASKSGSPSSVCKALERSLGHSKKAVTKVSRHWAVLRMYTQCTSQLSLKNDNIITMVYKSLAKLSVLNSDWLLKNVREY